jgi:anthranilate/para-aminobenzoate synthase component II
MESYSISLRLQRITVEYAYVSVRVNTDLVVDKGDGTARLDTDRLMQQAIEIESAAGVKWHPESVDIKPHPTQKAPEPGESDFLT